MAPQVLNDAAHNPFAPPAVAVSAESERSVPKQLRTGLKVLLGAMSVALLNNTISLFLVWSTPLNTMPTWTGTLTLLSFGHALWTLLSIVACLLFLLARFPAGSHRLVTVLVVLSIVSPLCERLVPTHSAFTDYRWNYAAISAVSLIYIVTLLLYLGRIARQTEMPNIALCAHLAVCLHVIRFAVTLALTAAQLTDFSWVTAVYYAFCGGLIVLQMSVVYQLHGVVGHETNGPASASGS